MRARTNCEMSTHSHLSSKHTPFANLRSSCHTYLSRHHRVGTHIHVVRYLHEVVELHAVTNNRGSHGRAVHTSVGTYFHIILNGYDSNLRNLLVAISRRSKTKSIGTNHNTCMKCDSRTQLAIVVNRHVRIDGAILTYRHVVVNHHIRIDGSATTNLHVFSYVCQRSHIAVLANLCRLGNDCLLANASLLLLHGLIHRQQLCHCLVSIIHTNQCGFHWLLSHEVTIHEHSARFCLIEIMFIFGIRQEGNRTRSSLFYLCKSSDLHTCIPFNCSTHKCCNLFRCKCH